MFLSKEGKFWTTKAKIRKKRPKKKEKNYEKEQIKLQPAWPQVAGLSLLVRLTLRFPKTVQSLCKNFSTVKIDASRIRNYNEY